MPTSIRLDGAGAVSARVANLEADDRGPASGMDVFPIRQGGASTNRALVNGNMYCTYFTASRTFSCAGFLTYASAAAPTPTLVRVGLYSVDAASWDLTALIASTVNDVTLFSVTATATRNWSSPAALVQGSQYAIGFLCITGAATPSIAGYNILGPLTKLLPPQGAVATGLGDLPASATFASMIEPGAIGWARLT